MNENEGVSTSSTGLSSASQIEPASPSRPFGLQSADVEDFFPFTVRYHETPHWTASPAAFRAAFIAAKPKDLTFYAYSVEILSRTVVRFTSYTMRDLCFGGVGTKNGEFGAVVSEDVTAEAVYQRVKRLAIARRVREMDAAEAVIIDGYCDQITQAIDARRAETGTGSVHESAVSEGNASTNQQDTIPTPPEKAG